MHETKQELLHKSLIVCTRHPSPYPFHDADSEKNLLRNPTALAISPEFSTVCLCGEDGVSFLVVINPAPTKRASVVKPLPKDTTKICFVRSKLYICTAAGKLHRVSVKNDDWVTGIVESNVNDMIVSSGMDNIDAICCVAGTLVSTTILLASNRQVYLGKVNDGIEIAVHLVLELERDVVDPCFSSDGRRMFALMHGGVAVEIVGNAAAGIIYRQPQTGPNIKAICATSTKLYVFRGPHVDQVNIALGAPTTVTTLLQNGAAGKAVIDDTADQATSGTIVAITCVANSVQFLDGAANALRFLCFGSSVLHYIKYVVSW